MVFLSSCFGSVILKEQLVSLSPKLNDEFASHQFHIVFMVSHAFPVVIGTELSVTAVRLQPPTHMLTYGGSSEVLWIQLSVIC